MVRPAGQWRSINGGWRYGCVAAGNRGLVVSMSINVTEDGIVIRCLSRSPAVENAIGVNSFRQGFAGKQVVAAERYELTALEGRAGNRRHRIASQA
jgi:hypothetical protein